jgi:hypothetical protein
MKRLTAYQLACGAADGTKLGNGISVTLWKEHNVYHVRAHDHEHHKRLWWHCFDTAAEAYKCKNDYVKSFRFHQAIDQEIEAAANRPAYPYNKGPR